MTERSEGSVRVERPVKRPQGAVHMVIVDKRIVLVGRRPRSKWYKVRCTCGKSSRQKDGSCRHEREVFAMLKPEIKERAHIGPFN